MTSRTMPDSKILPGLQSRLESFFGGTAPDAGLSLFRIALGIVLLVTTYKLWVNLDRNYLDQAFAFKYDFFEWVVPLDRKVMQALLLLLFAASGLLTLGVLIRISSLTYLIGYGYFFLLDASYYNNHYYVLLLLCFLFAVSGGGQSFSLQRFLAGKGVLGSSVPKWKLQMFRIQVFIIYFLGGTAKLNADWLRGDTMRFIFEVSEDFHQKSSFFQTDAAVHLYTYGGLAFDLIIGFLLFMPSWIPLAFIGILAFNVMNAYYFTIGIFPYLMVSATILFLRPDQLQAFLVRWLPGGSSGKLWEEVSPLNRSVHPPWVFIALYLTVQAILPVRHHFIEGNVDWTGEGKRFAWRMKQPCKIPSSFNIRFGHRDPDEKIDVYFKLNFSQANELIYYPTEILQLRDFLVEQVPPDLRDGLVFIPEIDVRMNGREGKPIFVPGQDLLTVRKYKFRHNSWIAPL